MNKRITLILVLMSVCVTGITCLQLYWNYQNYQRTIKAFSHDINEALAAAVDNELAERRQIMVNQVKKWLSDTSFITITCDTNNRYGETVFRMSDTHPLSLPNKPVDIGIKNFKQKLARITPEAKKIFIDHFGDNVLREDLKKGIIYYYTQRLGDSLSNLYEHFKMRMPALRQNYQEQLSRNGIHVDFNLYIPGKPAPGDYQTRKVNTSLNRPYEKEWVAASFPDPDTYFVKEMKWLVLTSLLLICITIACFIYTARTLLSQQKLSDMKDQFINNMTHELQTPLTSIAITAEAMGSFAQDRKTQESYLSIIQYQVSKLMNLADQLFQIRKLSTGKLLIKQQINFRNIIAEIANDLQPQTHIKKGAIIYEEVDEDLRIYADADQMRMILRNLLDNALKYSDKPAIVRVKADITQSEVLIHISDNGLGIPALYQRQIFEPFFRIPTGDRHDIKGYGLGLNLVRDLVQQHHGRIEVSANLPKGSIFTIRLPLK